VEFRDEQSYNNAIVEACLENGIEIIAVTTSGMLAYNGTEPDFIETDRSFTVRLWKEKKQ
jgi:hypothetical protein